MANERIDYVDTRTDRNKCLVAIEKAFRIYRIDGSMRCQAVGGALLYVLAFARWKVVNSHHPASVPYDTCKPT